MTKNEKWHNILDCQKRPLESNVIYLHPQWNEPRILKSCKIADKKSKTLPPVGLAWIYFWDGEALPIGEKRSGSNRYETQLERLEINLGIDRDDRIIDLLEAAHSSLFFAKTKPRSDDELQNISHNGYIHFLQGQITGILQAYSEDEQKWEKVSQPAQQRAYNNLPQNIKDELQREATEYGIASSFEVWTGYVEDPTIMQIVLGTLMTED